VTGMRAHFEHIQSFNGCPRGDNFSGQAAEHPDPLA
jgi:hypothetical protein